jgi:hypothetical protein
LPEGEEHLELLRKLHAAKVAAGSKFGSNRLFQKLAQKKQPRFHVTPQEPRPKASEAFPAELPLLKVVWKDW